MLTRAASVVPGDRASHNILQLMSSENILSTATPLRISRSGRAWAIRAIFEFLKLEGKILGGRSRPPLRRRLSSLEEYFYEEFQAHSGCSLLNIDLVRLAKTITVNTRNDY